MSRESNDFLLPATITFLNDREWQLRAGFFEHIACLAVNAGTAGLDAFLLPCVEQVHILMACFTCLSRMMGMQQDVECCCTTHSQPRASSHQTVEANLPVRTCLMSAG